MCVESGNENTHCLSTTHNNYLLCGQRLIPIVVNIVVTIVVFFAVRRSRRARGRTRRRRCRRWRVVARVEHLDHWSSFHRARRTFLHQFRQHVEITKLPSWHRFRQLHAEQAALVLVVRRLATIFDKFLFEYQSKQVCATIDVRINKRSRTKKKKKNITLSRTSENKDLHET